jgi:hypothetical protein
MNKSTKLAMTLAFVSIWVLLATRITTMWFTEELRVLSLLMAATAIAGSLLVLYFDWRGKLFRRISGERDEHRDLERAAWRGRNGMAAAATPGRALRDR